MLDEFEKHLRRGNLSNNTISAYLLTIRMYNQLSGEITKQNLLAFKGYLMETYKPKTVNLRIQAINKYLEFIKKEMQRTNGKSLCAKCGLACPYTKEYLGIDTGRKDLIKEIN